MPEIGTINADTCKVCGACGEVCPNRIMRKEDSKGMVFRIDRINLCFKCGQCMAVCPTKSISIRGLSYSRDFTELPRSRDYANAFMDMVTTRRAIRTFKDKPVPRDPTDENQTARPESGR